jgi:hypothetical protein
MVELTLAQAREIVAMFGGDEDEDATVTVQQGTLGHSGPGVYAWWTELPEEGSIKLADPLLDQPLNDALWAWLKDADGVEGTDGR